MVNFCSFKKATCILIFSLISFCNTGHSQNLIDNWSFEDTVACPVSLGQITLSSGWQISSGTPDYFNNCNTDTSSGSLNVSTPQNTVDFQYAKSGNAYSGLLTYSVLSPNGREFMGRQLNQVMQIGQTYYVSFYVSRPVNHVAYHTDVANNKIGALFTTYSPTPLGSPNNFSQVYTDSIITDTLNWVQIKGSFVADSNYQYIALGNFFDGNNTSFIQYDSNSIFAYYFFDDVCVSTDSLYCDILSGNSNLSTSAFISIFPNPARDWIVVGGNEVISLNFFDVSGRKKLSFYQIITPYKIDVSGLAAGLYLIQIETKKGIVFQKLILNNLN